MFHINSGLSFKSLGGGRSPVPMPRYVLNRRGHGNSVHHKTDESGTERGRQFRVRFLRGFKAFQGL